MSASGSGAERFSKSRNAASAAVPISATRREMLAGAATRCQLAQQPVAAQRDQRRDRDQQHDAEAAGVAVALQERQVLQQAKRPRDPRVVAHPAHRRPQRQQKEQRGRGDPEPRVTPPAMRPHAGDRQAETQNSQTSGAGPC